MISLTYFEVVRVMCRCNLNNTCTKFFIYIRVGNYWNFSVNERNNNCLSDNILISFIIRVYCQRSISKHCFRTCCSNFYKFVRILDWIVNMPEMTCLFFVFNFCIRDRSSTNRTPVDNSGTFVNIAFFIETTEHF